MTTIDAMPSAQQESGLSAQLRVNAASSGKFTIGQLADGLNKLIAHSLLSC